MGGLCLTCNDYGYSPFESLTAIAHNTFSQKDQLVSKFQYTVIHSLINTLYNI